MNYKTMEDEFNHQFHIIQQYRDFVYPQILHQYFFQFLYGLIIGRLWKFWV